MGAVNVELADVEVFLALAEELHFGRTAERLHLSSTRVSRRVQALEREIGGAVFTRTSRQVALTPLGRRLRDDLREAHDRFTAAIATARAAARNPAGVLTIGFVVTTAGTELDRLVSTFEHAHPDCTVTLREIPLGNPLPALRGGDIDVMVNWLVLDEPDLTIGPAIAEHPRVLAVSSDHPLADAGSVSAEVLADHPVLRWEEPRYPPELLRAIVPTHTPSGRPVLKHPVPVRTVSESASLVARGHAIHPTMASMSRTINRADIVLVPIADLPALPMGLVWCTDYANARIRALADIANALPTPR
jgi:DNA-binding transcriptional LysR family regulator